MCARTLIWVLPLISLIAAAPLARADDSPTTTPIKHLVVIFQENVSFDHYFATYPHPANPPGEPAFEARRGTPSVNGLSAGLFDHNPNSVQPFDAQAGSLRHRPWLDPSTGRSMDR